MEPLYYECLNEHNLNFLNWVTPSYVVGAEYAERLLLTTLRLLQESGTKPEDLQPRMVNAILKEYRAAGGKLGQATVNLAASLDQLERAVGLVLTGIYENLYGVDPIRADVYGLTDPRARRR